MELDLSSPNIKEEAKITSLDLLPEPSKLKYQRAYSLFMEWRENKKEETFSEDALLAYFVEISERFRSSTLWTHYSMLRTTLSIMDKIDISQYLKLKAFLKQQSDGYSPKKSQTFTPNEIDTFIREAPDEIYLVTKVALIMGVMGACRRHELHQMKITHFQDFGTGVMIKIPDTKVVRNFTLTGYFYDIFKKYLSLRPKHIKDPAFFLNYQKGKCTVQKIGINKLGAMGKHIAKYLKLPNPEMYTGHCFRRSSATIIVDSNGDISPFKRVTRGKSATCVKEYLEDSMVDKLDIAKQITKAIKNLDKPDTSLTEKTDGQSPEENSEFQENINIEQSGNATKIVFSNCTFKINR